MAFSLWDLTNSAAAASLSGQPATTVANPNNNLASEFNNLGGYSPTNMPGSSGTSVNWANRFAADDIANGRVRDPSRGGIPNPNYGMPEVGTTGTPEERWADRSEFINNGGSRLDSLRDGTLNSDYMNRPRVQNEGPIDYSTMAMSVANPNAVYTPSGQPVSGVQRSDGGSFGGVSSGNTQPRGDQYGWTGNRLTPEQMAARDNRDWSIIAGSTPQPGDPGWSLGMPVNSSGQTSTGQPAVQTATAPQGAIVDMYQNLLFRAPDAEGLAWWRSARDAGTSLEDIHSGISNSVEAQAYKMPTGYGGSQFQSVNPETGAPATGLIGSENALTSSANDAIQALSSAQNEGSTRLQSAYNTGRSDINAGIAAITAERENAAEAVRAGNTEGMSMINTGIDRFNPMAQEGNSASAVQAALSGAMGVEAQREALANLQPVDSFLQEQGDQSVLRQQAALGGLGGANVMKELSRFNQGLAQQSHQQQFQNLGDTANRGFSALQGQGQLSAQGANMAANTGASIGQLGMQAAQAVANANLSNAQLGANSSQQQSVLGANAANQIANMYGNTGSQLSAGRTNAGNAIANNLAGSTGAIADLQFQQGQGISDLAGQISGNLANLLSGQGQLSAANQLELATLLANLATQTGSQSAQTSANIGAINSEGTAGKYQAIGNGLMGLGEAVESGISKWQEKNP